MKRLLPLAALALIALLALAVWWATGTTGGGSSPAQLSHAADPDAAPRNGAAALEPGLVASGSPAATGLAAAGDEDRARVAAGDAERRAALAGARRLAGRVLVPAGCTADDELEVFAMAAPFSADTLHAVVADLRRGEELPKWAVKSKWTSARVEPDGTFELALDPEAEKHHLSVLGNTQYMQLAVPLVSDAPRLEPACGAWLKGRVLLPPDAQHDAQAQDLSDVTLQLETSVDPTQVDFMKPGEIGRRSISRKVEAAADGTFEFRGVPAGQGLNLTVECARFAATRTLLEQLLPGEQRTTDVRLSLGASIAGRVVDEAGVPIAGAEVAARGDATFFGFGKPVLRKAETGADGTFELGAVPPGKVNLHAGAEGYLENVDVKVEAREGAPLTGVELELTAGSALAGTLTWPDGRPAAGATVKVRFDQAMMFGMTALNSQRGANGEDATDDAGAFRVTGLGKGPFTVTAEARPASSSDDEGRQWKARQDGVQPDALGLALVLAEPLLLKGRVVDQDDLPVTKFEVVAEQPGEGLLGNLGKEQRDEDFESDEGRFELDGLFPGTWQVVAIADGFGVPETLELTLPQARGDELLIRLVRAARVAGSVLGSDGKPVSGAEVAVDLGGPAWQAALQPEFKRPKTKSGTDGAFLLEGLAPGAITLRATHADHASSEPVQVELAVGEHRDEVSIVLRVGALLTGEVYGEDGEPARARMIQATKMDTYDSQMTFTDGEGRFKLEHLDPGTWQVVSLPPGFASGGQVEEAAYDGDASEQAEDETDRMLGLMSQIKTAVAELIDGEEKHVVIGAPPKDPVRVFGTVTHDGEPYSGALITFYAEGANTMASLRNQRVKADGTFEVELEEPGTYVVQVQMLDDTMTQQRIIEFSRRIPEAEEYELHLEVPIGRVSGTVEGPDGAPLAGVRVSLHPEGALETGTLWGGQYAESTTDAEGRFDFQGLRAGKYSLMAGGMAYGGMMSANASYGRDARSIVIAEGRWLDGEDFRLKTPGKIAVTVLDGAGQPVPEAAVFVRDARGHLLDRMSMITTGSNGSAEYAGVAPGDYTITVRKGDLASQETSAVRVSSEETTKVSVRMEASTLLLITLVGEEGELLNAFVSVRDASEREVSGMLALTELMTLFSDGFSSTEHRVGPLPPGRYTATAELADGRKTTKAVTLTGRPERKLTLRFD